MTLFTDIKPLAVKAGVQLHPIDEMLCERIDTVSANLSRNNQLPFNGLNVSFESEFLIPPEDLPFRFENRNPCVPAREFLAGVDPNTYAKFGCKIIVEDGIVKMMEAQSHHSDGSYSSQSECIREYFQFRSQAKQDVDRLFPKHRYQRYGEHLHFSFRDATGKNVENLDPRFIALLEASLKVHWQAVRPLVTAKRALVDVNAPTMPQRPCINEIGVRTGKETGDLNHFFVKREEPHKHHYEIRRTLPGHDTPERHIPCNPALFTHALLAASVNIALAAYSDPALESSLLTETKKVEHAPAAYGLNIDELIQEMRQSSILNHPASIGADLMSALIQEMDKNRRKPSDKPTRGVMKLRTEKSIAFLLQSNVNKDNLRYLVNGAIDAGFSVSLVDINSLHIENNTELLGQSARISGKLSEKFEIRELPFTHERIDAAMLWLLSRGTRNGFMDRMQILTQIHDNLGIPVVNTPNALIKYGNKYAMMMAPGYKQPLTHVDQNPDSFLKIIRAHPDQYFILKPPAGSLGYNVFKLRADSPDLEQVIKKLTADAEGVPQYAVLQECIPEIEKNGDKRVVLAGGKIIGAYARKNNGDHRTNLSQGSTPTACDLTEDERKLCYKLAHELQKDGCQFAGIDLCYPYVIEVNCLNPGGLGSIDRLTGKNHSQEAVEAVWNSVQKRSLDRTASLLSA